MSGSQGTPTPQAKGIAMLTFEAGVCKVEGCQTRASCFMGEGRDIPNWTLVGGGLSGPLVPVELVCMSHQPEEEHRDAGGIILPFGEKV